MSWAYIQVFQYLFDYLGGNMYLSLFFHLFIVKHSSENCVQAQGLIILVHVIRYFEVFLDSMKHFKNWIFYVAPLHKETHATVCTIVMGTENARSRLFHMYWNQGHFLK